MKSCTISQKQLFLILIFKNKKGEAVKFKFRNRKEVFVGGNASLYFKIIGAFFFFGFDALLF